jgi:hypothetical protein
LIVVCLILYFLLLPLLSSSLSSRHPCVPFDRYQNRIALLTVIHLFRALITAEAAVRMVSKKFKKGAEAEAAEVL